MPNGPSALRAYAPARTRVAERPPRASWAFFCAVDADVDADEDEDVEDNVVEVVKGEEARRRRGAGLRSRLRRNVVTIMSFLFSFLRVFLERESEGSDELVVTVVRGGLSFGWVDSERRSHAAFPAAVFPRRWHTPSTVAYGKVISALLSSLPHHIDHLVYL